MAISAAEAHVELSVLESKAQDLDRLDALTRFTNAGLPQEVVQRLQALWDAREQIGGRVVHIGKIIYMEINRFIDENRSMALGVALGAAVGALTAMIPWIGPMLAPFALATGILIGAIAGHELDAGIKAKYAITQIAQEFIVVAQKFFELLSSIINVLRTPADAKSSSAPA